MVKILFIDESCCLILTQTSNLVAKHICVLLSDKDIFRRLNLVFTRLFCVFSVLIAVQLVQSVNITALTDRNVIDSGPLTSFPDAANRDLLEHLLDCCLHTIFFLELKVNALANSDVQDFWEVARDSKAAAILESFSWSLAYPQVITILSDFV